jgi:drug/metabolite transporter (DMT)-like permease
MRKYILPVITAILFGFVWIAGKYLADSIPPITMAFLRYCFAMVVFAPVLWHYRQTIAAIPKRDWPYLFLAAVLSVITYHILFYWALHFTNPTNLSLIHAANPLLTLVLAFLLLKQSITKRMLLGFALGVLGVWIVVSHGKLTGIGFYRGEQLMLLATLAWAGFTIVSKHLASRQLNSLVFTAVISLIGWLLLLPASLVEVNMHFFAQLDSTTWLSLIYMGVGSSGLGYWLYSRSVAELGPAYTSFIVFSTVPMVVAIEEVLWFHSSIQLSQVIGFICICAGLAVATLKIVKS